MACRMSSTRSLSSSDLRGWHSVLLDETESHGRIKASSAMMRPMESSQAGQLPLHRDKPGGGDNDLCCPAALSVPASPVHSSGFCQQPSLRTGSSQFILN